MSPNHIPVVAAHRPAARGDKCSRCQLRLVKETAAAILWGTEACKSAIPMPRRGGRRAANSRAKVVPTGRRRTRTEKPGTAASHIQEPGEGRRMRYRLGRFLQL